MTQISKELIPALQKAMDIDLPENISRQALEEKLSAYINHLIQYDFPKLVSVLYSIDVSETKLKSLLKDHPGTDAGKVISGLIIERQLQKIKSRQKNSRGSNISEEESW